MIKFFDAFGGIGGFRLGLERAGGFEAVGYCEFDKYAVECYNTNFKEKHEPTDITTLDAGSLPDFDLFVGGFPCQPFSLAGKRKAFNDTRGTLFFHIARVLEVKKPRFILLENVKGLLSAQNGEAFSIICETLNNLGYYINVEIYNSKNFGVPQNRERVFLLCYRINALVNIGQDGKLTLSEKILQEFLFQNLLKNLKEVKKLQELKSKDLVLGLILLKEIINGLKLKIIFCERTQNYLLKNYPKLFQIEDCHQSTLKAGNSELERKKYAEHFILTLMEENGFGLDANKVWQSIDILLNKSWEENFQERNKSITLTAINSITNQTTYTYTQMFLYIYAVIVHWRNSLNHSWIRALSNLILLEENMNYARMFDSKKDGFISKSGISYKFDDFEQNRERVFIFGVRNECSGKIFPFRENNTTTNELQKQTTNTLTTRYGTAHSVGTYLIENQRDAQKLIALDAYNQSIITNGLATAVRTNMLNGGTVLIEPLHKHGGEMRVYDETAPTITTRYGTGGDNVPYVVADRTRTVVGTETTNTITGVPKDNLILTSRIRRLTPVECERLQGFPDNWTSTMSDSRRYKALGNAVTVNVIQAIGKKIKEVYEKNG